MTKYILVSQDYVFRETYEYRVDEPLPDNWESMTDEEKLFWLGGFESETIDQLPAFPPEDRRTSIIEYEVTDHSNGEPWTPSVTLICESCKGSWSVSGESLTVPDKILCIFCTVNQHFVDSYTKLHEGDYDKHALDEQELEEGN